MAHGRSFWMPAPTSLRAAATVAACRRGDGYYFAKLPITLVAERVRHFSPNCVSSAQLSLHDTEGTYGTLPRPTGACDMSILQGEQPGVSRSTAAWSELDLLDRNPDPAFDELTALAAVLCRADFAYIAWIDQSRLWFKSRHGFCAVEQPRALLPCHWAAESAAP